MDFVFCFAFFFSLKRGSEMLREKSSLRETSCEQNVMKFNIFKTAEKLRFPAIDKRDRGWSEMGLVKAFAFFQ